MSLAKAVSLQGGWAGEWSVFPMTSGCPSCSSPQATWLPWDRKPEAQMQRKRLGDGMFCCFFPPIQRYGSKGYSFVLWLEPCFSAFKRKWILNSKVIVLHRNSSNLAGLYCMHLEIQIHFKTATSTIIAATISHFSICQQVCFILKMCLWLLPTRKFYLCWKRHLCSLCLELVACC